MTLALTMQYEYVRICWCGGSSPRSASLLSLLQRLEGDMVLLPGDCLLASAFLSYVGPFLSQYRDELVQETWLKQVRLSDSEGSRLATNRQHMELLTHHTCLSAAAVTTACAGFSLSYSVHRLTIPSSIAGEGTGHPFLS